MSRQPSPISTHLKPFLQRNAPVLLGLLLVWNMLLAIALVGRFQPRVPPPDQAEEPASSPTADSLAQPFLNALPVAGREGGNVLDNRRYTFRLPMPQEAVAAIWHNGRPILTQIADTAGTYKFDLRLRHGENELAVSVWRMDHSLIYRDRWNISITSALVEKLSRSMDRGSRHHPEMALTFDGGSVAEGAVEILNILWSRGITTTLFLTGQFIEKNPRLVLQMLADGHEIANHTYNHPHLTTFADNGLPETLEGADRDFLQGQLFRTDSLFRALTGIPMQPYWRAPYGEINPDILVWAAEAGYRHIHWSPGMDTMDWVSDSTSTLFRSPEAIAERLWEHARKKDGLNGGIVLMHLGTTRTGKPVYTILDALIRDLQKAGYRPVKISQMLENGTFPG